MRKIDLIIFAALLAVLVAILVITALPVQGQTTEPYKAAAKPDSLIDRHAADDSIRWQPEIETIKLFDGMAKAIDSLRIRVTALEESLWVERGRADLKEMQRLAEKARKR